MSEESTSSASVEETLFRLLQNGGAGSMDQGSLLVLMSLVNLMGIIDIINYRIGLKKAPVSGAAAQPAGGPGGFRPGGPDTKGPPLDPAALFSALGGKEGGGLGPGQLAGLLSRFMPPPGSKAREGSGEAAMGVPGPSGGGDQGSGDGK